MLEHGSAESSILQVTQTQILLQELFAGDQVKRGVRSTAPTALRPSKTEEHRALLPMCVRSECNKMHRAALQPYYNYVDADPLLEPEWQRVERTQVGTPPS
eukprot:6119674-Amphidinium_carterae.1